MPNTEHLLQPEEISLIPVVGNYVANQLNSRADEVWRTRTSEDPNVTVGVRTLNEASALERLLYDVNAQKFSGEIEIVVVDNESSDHTPQIAQAYGATVVSLARRGFTYPKSMNMVMDAASHDLVLMTVGHASLSNAQALRGGSRHFTVRLEGHLPVLYLRPTPHALNVLP